MKRMTSLYTPRAFTAKSKQHAIAQLLDNTIPDRDFYLLVIGAVLLGACGIFLDSLAVLIASMLVAPLAYPILGLGLAIVARDTKLAGRTAGMLGLASGLAIVAAAVVRFVVGNVELDRVFVTFSSHYVLATGIAVIAGSIAAYGLVRVKVGAAMTGIGIAVSLMPPLVATGIDIAAGNLDLALNTFIIFVLNVIGILVASIVMFSLFGLGRIYRSDKQ